MYLRKATSPCAMSPIAPERFSISVSRDGWRCTLSRSKRSTCLISLTTLIRGAAIRRCASHADNNPAPTISTARPISRLRIVIWTGPRNSDLGTTVTSDQPGKRDRRQHRLIGLAALRHMRVKRLAFAGPVGVGLLHRLDCDRKQRMIGLQRHRLAGIRIGRRDHLAVAFEDEGAGRLSDRELRQEIRHPRQFDDDGDHAGGLVVDIDRRRERRRQPLALRMRREGGPEFVVGLDGGAEPFLIGDANIRCLRPGCS